MSGSSKSKPRAKDGISSPGPNMTTRSRKRVATEDATESIKPAKKKRSTIKQRSAADPYDPVNNLVDSLQPGLRLVFIGLNPGLKTAETGHAYAHPSNLFWKLLHQSGVTLRRHLPSETRDLMHLYSIGNTNICARPTRSGAGLSKEELNEGASILEEKIAEFKPEAVCIVGKGIWEVIYKAKTGVSLKSADFGYGWQREDLWLGKTFAEDGSIEWQGARTFVATTTSGLAAGMKPNEKLEVWKPLGQWFRQQGEAGTTPEEVKQEVENIKTEIKNEEGVR